MGCFNSKAEYTHTHKPPKSRDVTTKTVGSRAVDV